LLIGGSPDSSELLVQGLEASQRLTVEVARVEGLAKGLRHLGKETPDAILLDLDATGEGVLDSLQRVQTAARGVPVIAFCEHDDHHQAVEALQAGAQDYLTSSEVAGGLLERAILYAIERKGAVEAVMRSERRYEELVHSLDSILWEADARTLKMTFVSPQVERILGFSPEQWLAEPYFWKNHLHPDDREWATTHFVRSAAEMKSHQMEYRMIAADGRTIWFRDIVAITVEDNNPVKLFGIMVDITDQKRAQHDLDENQQQYQRIFESTTDGLVINDWDGNVVEVNPAFAAMHGYTREEMIGMPPPNFIHPDSHDLLRLFFETVAAGQPFECQAMDVRKDGTAFHVDVRGVSFTYRGEPHILGIVRDTTERVQAYEKLKEQEEQYRAIFESTTDGLAIGNLDRVTVAVNPAFAAMHGYTPEELIGHDPRTYIHPDYHEFFGHFYEKVSAGGPYKGQAVDVRKDGSTFPVEVTGTTLTYRGEPHVLGVIRDITERVEAEERARMQEEQYRAIFEATTDGLTINTLDGTLVEVNPAFAAMHGYTREELRGMNPLTFIHPDDHQFVPEAFAAFRDGKEYSRRESRDIRKDGTVFPVDVMGTQFMYRGEPHILCIVRDITERVQAHEELRLKEEQYRAVFEATSDGLAIANLDAIPVEVNPAFAAMHGYEREEILGLDPSAYVHPDSLPLLAEYYEKVRAGERFHTEAMDLRRDGTPFPVEVHELPITYKGQPHTLAIVRDISERVEAYEKLRKRQIEIDSLLEEYRGIFEATTDGISIGDLDGNVAEVNPAFCEMVGYTREELIGKPATLWVHPDSHDMLRDAYATVLSGKRWENQGVQVRKDGSTFPVDVICTAFTYRGEPHVLGIIRDATERVQALELLEQGVAERTQELSTLLEVTHNVASTLELEPLLERILQQLRLVADYSRASITIGEDDLTTLSAWGDDPGKPLPEHQPLYVDALGVVGEKMRAGKPSIINDMRSDDVAARIMQEAIARSQEALSSESREALEAIQREERSVLLVPVMLKEDLIGGLTLRHKVPGYYAERHAKVAMGIANQAAVAIGNARLYRQAQETTRKTAALVQTASQIAFGGSLQSTLEVLCERVASVVGAVASSVLLYDNDTQLPQMAAAHGLPEGYVEALNGILGSGVKMLMQDAFSGRNPMFLADLRSRVMQNKEYAPLHPFVKEAAWEGVVAVPMVYRDRLLGVLLSYHPSTNQIGEAEITFHNVIADQAAVAVENARLLSQAHEKATLEERQRLARELHDSVTQALFSINLIARSVEVMLQREGTHAPDTMEKMADLRQLTQGALAEMRALIFELRPGALEEEGLIQALRKHAAAVQGREQLQIDVDAYEAEVPRLKPAAEEALYRIGQEALHNIAKHARAAHVQVSLKVERPKKRGETIVLRIADDGMGFDPTEVPVGHMGLGTMTQRAVALGGECTVESTPGKGTVVEARLPLAEWRLPR
jgi:PAS domain S-box-containing protein